MGVLTANKRIKCSNLNIAGGKVTLSDDSYGLYLYNGLTVNGGDVTITNNDDRQGTIYCVNGDAFITLNGGTAEINGAIYNCKNINLNGGNVTVNGEIYNRSGYTVTYDYAHATDSYYIQAFSSVLDSGKTRTVKVKDGLTFLCNGKSYSGTLTNNQISAISGKTMTPDISADFSKDSDTEYTIHTANGWDKFCDALANNNKGIFDGKTVKLGTGIEVTRMAGGSQHDFTGTFDGQGHTLTLKYGSAGSPVNKQYVTPFLYTTDNNGSQPKFRNLTIDGSIYEAYTGSGEHHVGGLIAKLYGTVTIEHCTSNVSITTTGGAGGFVGNCENAVSFTDCVSHATIHSAGGSNSGFVGWSRDSKYTISFAGCLFNGKLLQVNGSGQDNGGFIGWKGDNKTVTITNSICAPAALAGGETMADGNSATFSREHANYAAAISNSYYAKTFGTAQGLGYSSASAPANIGTAGTAYTTSGITTYTRGLLYGGLYYMTPEAVSLADNAANNVDAINGYFADVTLTGRTLYKDGDWNTLCLPFSLSAEQIAASNLVGADIRQLSNASIENQTLNLTFTPAAPAAGAVTAIEAGTPYIIKWTRASDYTNDDAHNIVSPLFTGVTIDATDRSYDTDALNTDEDNGNDVETDLRVRFLGTYKSTTFENENQSILFLGTDNTLYWPQPKDGKNPSIGAFRAYFMIGNGTTFARQLTAFNLNFGDSGETMSLNDKGEMINDKEAGAWYDLQGRKLESSIFNSQSSIFNSQSSIRKKGLYIHNGKKVVVK